MNIDITKTQAKFLLDLVNKRITELDALEYDRTFYESKLSEHQEQERENLAEVLVQLVPIAYRR